ncbi:hypothetical protein Bca52824_035070 [Brassica carinata]|uniref:Replication protein A OB domain-containing protein n=1 Tax=Brassica carinata TaxID=52824 RepID=A0A8X7RZY5_BRACI|nr:hypothetical protein Bca52824_035070 [Brassica carinata]
MLRIQHLLPIDSWGVIEHVTVTAANGQYRTTNYKYKMVIGDDAVLSSSSLVDDRIFLSLANYGEVENGTKKQNFLIDVIGRIHELGAVQTVQVSGEDIKRVQGNNLACCLWGTYAEQLEPFSDAGRDQIIICLIRFAKIKEFREMQITDAFDASRLYLNAIIPELTDLSQRLSNDNLSVAMIDKPTGKKDGKRVTYNWNDAEIKTISKVVEVNQIEDPEILPEPVSSFVGKSFCFGLSITSDNVTNGSDTFVVLEVCSGDNVLTCKTVSQSNSDMVTNSSTMSSGSVMMLDQISSDECLTPITKRKEDDSGLQDLTSTSKKQCTKLIKQEKTKTD